MNPETLADILLDVLTMKGYVVVLDREATLGALTDTFTEIMGEDQVAKDLADFAARYPIKAG